MSDQSNLSQGAALEIEDLDVSGLGLYHTKDPSVPDSDYFPAEEAIGRWGVGYWMRHSDEGKKRHTFKDTELKLHSNLGKSVQDQMDEHMVKTSSAKKL